MRPIRRLTLPNFIITWAICFVLCFGYSAQVFGEPIGKDQTKVTEPSSRQVGNMPRLGVEGLEASNNNVA